ncbi:MAG: tetratricopeptide repeat protein, partial [Polyangiaceae bacterium]
MPDQTPGASVGAERGAATIIEAAQKGGGGLLKVLAGAAIFAVIGVGFWAVLGKKLWGPSGGTMAVIPNGGATSGSMVVVPLSRLAGRVPPGVTGQIQIGLQPPIDFAATDQQIGAGTAMTLVFVKRGYKPIRFPFVAKDSGVTDPPLESLKFQFELADELQSSLDEAQRDFDQKRYRDAMTLLDDIIREAPDYAPARQLHDTVDKFLKEYRDMASQGRDALTARRFSDAIAILSKIPETAEEYSNAQAMKSSATMQLQTLNDEQTSLETQLRGGSFDAASDTLRQIRLLLPPGDTSCDAQQKTIREAQEAFESAKREMDNKQYKKALDYLDIVLKIAPRHDEASRMQAQARTIVEQSLSTEQK